MRFEDLVRVLPPVSAEGKRTATQVGDLLISITADLGLVGVIPEGFAEAYVNQHLAMVRLGDPESVPRFVGHFLLGRAGQIQFETLNESGAKAGLNLPTVSRILTAKPTPPEQRAIAEILDVADETVACEQRDLGKLHRLKRGLMQNLLTGKVRVTRILGKATEAN